MADEPGRAPAPRFGPKRIVPSAGYVAPVPMTVVPGGPQPQLVNHGGPLIESVQVVPIYWGSAWATGANATLTTQVDGFFDFIVTSSVMDLLAEYGTTEQPIQHGKRLVSARVTGSEPGDVTSGGRQVTDAQIQQAIQGWIAGGTVPAPTPNTLYFVYLPPDVTCLGPDGEASCSVMCGYHDHIGGNIFYAVIPYGSCTGCVFPGNFLDTLTEVSTHELCEAITDPTLSTWWNPDTGAEIGDICNRQTTRLGGYLIQTEWSNSQNACAYAPEKLWSLQQINAGGLTGGPAATAGPFASAYSQQWHVVYPDAGGTIWDSWYEGGSGIWSLQQINANGLTGGPAAVGAAFAAVSGQQWHVTWRDAGGTIWDAWYDPASAKWGIRQINAGGMTTGPAAAGDPCASVYGQQWHVTWRDAAGTIWDAWCDLPSGKWYLQQINALGLTAGPAAAGDPLASLSGSQWHVIWRDAAGTIWDAWYDPASGKWNLRQINAGGVTAGPAATGDACTSVYGQQWHVTYRDGGGVIRDCWSDLPSGKWYLQQINAGGLTTGAAAAGNPFTSVYGQQWHVTYRTAGTIWDAWYDPGSTKWFLQQLNAGGLTGGAAAAGDPFALVYGHEWHVTYRDPAGTIWDPWYY
jgi:hypothetical protein